MATPDFLTIDDLYRKIGTRRVQELFDDDGDGDITGADELAAIAQVLNEAESLAYSKMLQAYGDKASIVTLAQNDEVFLGHCAWVALELASERRVFSNGTDGKGYFVYQYDRAVQYFKDLAQGRQRSKGEALAGTSGNVGGVLQPAMTADEPHFLFNRDRYSTGGHGTF